MAKHVIFLLHGMGKHEDGWSKGAQAILKNAYDSFPSLEETPFEQYFEFHELIIRGVR